MAKVQERYREIKESAERRMFKAQHDDRCVIQVGSATCELAAGSGEIRNEFAKLIRASGRKNIEIKETGCTGRCAQEPIVGLYIPGEMPYKYEQVTTENVQEIFHQHVIGGTPVLELLLDKKTDNLYRHVMIFCSSSYCEDQASKDWSSIIQEKLRDHDVSKEEVRIFSGGCLGLCPGEKRGESINIMVFPQCVTYQVTHEDDLDRIIKTHIIEGAISEEHVIELDPLTKHFLSQYGDVAFFNKQTRLTLRNSGLVNPESLDEYIFYRGFEGLAKVLEQPPGNVIGEIEKAGLRGRGGAGFPTGRKWKAAADTGCDIEKYVICNADEGDPGAFMDRSALEGDPFSIIEGMTIGAYAIGARHGYIYIRAEYPLAIRRLQNAIDKAHKAGLLGKNILNSSFDFHLEIRLGAGAYVCGEETALMFSIEGKRGQPRIRPPYPTESGLWGKPTVINNVETWANIPVIFNYGSEWFARIGTEQSSGTKVFALAGKVKNTGLIEVPMGTTLRDIIFDVGGGLPNGNTLKAVQTGGPSGGCIPAGKIDTPVDYDSLNAVGSIMGSGGMIVLDERDCMVATSKFFLEFTQNESCGKCVPCREGTLRMLEILERITNGEGIAGDLDTLERLAHLIKKTSLCGLGQTAPNPVLSTLKYFRGEFVAHVEEKRCPAQKCPSLIRYEIDPEQCTGCTVCARRCPVSCIQGRPKTTHVIDQADCIQCGECYNTCKFDAVRKR